MEFSGAVTADEFYTMYNNYVSLKERSCKICTVCGVRRPVDRLNDALAYFDLLRATSDQTDMYNAHMQCNTLKMILVPPSIGMLETTTS